MVVRKRTREDGQPEVQYRWKGRKKPLPGAWLLATDPTVRVPANVGTIKKNWRGQQGHLGRDEYVAEQIMDERGEGNDKEYLVRWLGWSCDDDTWEPARNILDQQLVADFDAARAERAQAAEAARAQRAQAAQAARRAATTAAEQEQRRLRAQFGANFIRRMRSKVLTELCREALTARSIAYSLVQPERCDDWEFKALYEYLETLIPEGESRADHLTDYKQKKGNRGGPTVLFEFHVISHRLLGLFVNCKEGGTRWEHVAYKRKGAGMAVALMPPMTFKRRGPRADPDKINATVTAGVGVLSANNKAPPDWLFSEDVPEDDQRELHKPAIAGRVLDIHSSNPGVVQAEVVREGRKY